MKLPTNEKSSDAAIGEGVVTSTVVTRIFRDSTARRRSTRPGRSKASRRHSRYVSSTIGKLGYCCATASRSAERFRCAQSGVRLADVVSREEERAGRRLAEARREHRGAAELAGDRVLDLVGGREEELDGQRLFTAWDAEDHAVVGGDGLDVARARLAELAEHRHRPRRMHAAAERREHADAEVAELVGHTLDDDRLVARDGARRGDLVLDVRDEIDRRSCVEMVLLVQQLARRAGVEARDGA